MNGLDALPELMTMDQLAERLGVTHRHVRRLVDERRVPFLRVETSSLLTTSRPWPYLVSPTASSSPGTTPRVPIVGTRSGGWRNSSPG